MRATRTGAESGALVGSGREGPEGGEPDRPLRILLIEDNPDHAFFEQQALERELDAVVEAELRPDEGLRRLREGRFDAVVLDYNLPGEDGLDVLRRIKSIRGELPVILITAFGDEEVAVEAMKEGASDYLVKRFGSPAQEGKLAAAVAKALRQAQLAQAYRRSQELLRTALELAWDGVAYVSLDTGRTIFANEAFSRMAGLGREDLERRSLRDLFVPEDRARLDALVDGVRASGAAGARFEGELRLLRPDGRQLVADLRATQAEIGGERCALLAARDITEKKRLAEHLVQAQKMEAVGRLAGGIAHDFNNLLGAILGYASYLKRRLDPQDRTYRSAGTIEAAAERAADLVQRLLSFARSGPPEAVPFSLNRLVEETVRLLQRSVAETIRIECALGPGLPAVEGDETQLQQALLNILLNARDAMPRGGVLAVATWVAAREEAPRPERPFVAIAVRDTGVGMPPEVRARIFEPFFTTKARGKGTGLGLASAYAIVKAHGGEIEVFSEEGRGTEVRIFLPASEKPAREVPAEPPVEGGAHGTVLVVDDEAPIRDLTSDILAELGYRVVLAATGPEAVERFAALRDGVDLVILDIVMPGMDGLETFRRLRAIDPGVRVLVSSGYSPEGTAAEALREGAVGFVQKPYRMAELARAVRAALRAPQS